MNLKKEVFLLSLTLMLLLVQQVEVKKSIRCKSPVRINNGIKASNRRFYRVGQKLLYRCKTGYKKENQTTPLCTETGKWSHGTFDCKPINCGKPSMIRYGKYSANSFIYRSKAFYKCNYGYKMIGRPFRTCKKNGKWSKKPSCRKYRCRIKGRLRIINGRVTTTDQTLSHGATMVFKCKSGYDLIGADTITCLEGHWSSKRIPYCKARACPDPGNPENGYRLGSNYRVGSTVRFICGPGYKLRGSRSRTCLKSKTWNGKLAICDSGRWDCPALGNPVSGFKIGNRYSFGSIVRFRCKPGYILHGSSHRLCTNKGTWNGTESKCVDLFEHLVTNVNQTAIILRKSLDSMLEFTCSGGNKVCNTSGYDSRARKVSVDLRNSRGLDVLFIFDASSSIKNEDFKLGVKFAMRLVHVLKPTWKPKGTRVAAIVYATKAQVVFNFRDHSAYSINGVRSMLKKLINVRAGNITAVNIPKRLRKDGVLKGGTASALALEMAATKVFLTQKSKRQRVIFFITDGMSNIGGSPKRWAKKLKDKPKEGGFNVDMYAIGVGQKVDEKNLYKELYGIASEGKDHVIIVSSLEELDQASQKAIQIKYDYSPCGEGSSFYENRGRIAGGSTVTKGKWPWQVGIYLTASNELELLCGGALIEPGWVLTAAHCLYKKRKDGQFQRLFPSGLIVTAGDNSLAVNAENLKSSTPDEFFEPDDFNRGISLKNDIALIKLQKPFTLGPFVRKICLPTAKNLDKPGDLGYVAGWGKTKPYRHGLMAKLHKNSNVLLESRFEIQPNKICVNSTSERHRDDFDPDVVFCAGDGKGGNDACHGDSGGSFMRFVKQNGTFKWVSIGLVSWGEGCGMPNKYGMYTKVEPFIGWIKQTIRDNS